MNYFVPEGIDKQYWGDRRRGRNGEGQWRLGFYRGWYMSVSEYWTKTHQHRYESNIWWLQVSFHKKGFVVEKDAYEWCTKQIDSRFKKRVIVEDYCDEDTGRLHIARKIYHVVEPQVYELLEKCKVESR
jgi:hypothetical protein